MLDCMIEPDDEPDAPEAIECKCGQLAWPVMRWSVFVCEDCLRSYPFYEEDEPC